jgi:hypothetical protein
VRSNIGAGGSYGGSGGRNQCNGSSFSNVDYQVYCLFSLLVVFSQFYLLSSVDR